MTAPILQPTPENIAKAANILRAGGLVAMPTETVYGLAADATNAQAIVRLYEAKGRPRFNPLIAHVADMEMARKQGVFSKQAAALAQAFWPGPLTLVVDLEGTSTVSDIARAGLNSIALRCPAHGVARALLTVFGGPLVAPSANPSGKISPTRADHVANDMGERVDLILDGGPCESGVESTIIDARGHHPALLRPGSLSAAEIEAIWPGLVRPENNADAPVSPGQLLRHYAPKARLRLNVTAPDADEAVLGFGPVKATLNLSPSGNLAEAASNLFFMLRQLDQTHSRIAVSPIPEDGLGEAINDRLIRAASR
ncbi:L-threonylcarbamoyladenylate synthase [Hyphomonas sp. FCG-A18]|uniref:L-threonylcarbamoyladenylate synthase n=1 Tax=Hyphomonas sp. FCG-A18 TaxID=3080019 RepID=UPI002B27E934|nr:L-threonylcarbamoyladenylate synthase [Hyphomonas sp. FCG-A18]